MNYRLSRCPLTFCASLLSPGDGCDRAATEGVKGSREEAPGSRDLGGRRMGRRWPKKGALDAWLGAEDAPLGSFAATPRGTSSAKGEYRKDSGLPGSGCSHSPQSPLPAAEARAAPRRGGRVSSAPSAAFIRPRLPEESGPYGRPSGVSAAPAARRRSTPSARGGLGPRRDGRTECGHFLPGRCVPGL